MKQSDVVRSTHGHDKGGIFMVLAVEGEYVFLADGRKRRVEKPKKKKIKHAQKIASMQFNLDNATNKSVWAALKQYREG